jgi:hypothetical protein
MQQKDNRICVIARYKENLDWVNKLDSSIVIYNKSDTFEYNFPKHDVSNYGRETESFIRFIIQYYNQLDAFDSVIFLQGNPFEHCNSILELIKNTDHKTFAYLSDRNANASFPDSDYFKMHLSKFELDNQNVIPNPEKINIVAGTLRTILVERDWFTPVIEDMIYAEIIPDTRIDKTDDIYAVAVLNIDSMNGKQVKQKDEFFIIQPDDFIEVS